MKIILLKTISSLGKKFDVKEVKPGYAKNYLLPKKMAILATKTSLEQIQRLKTEAEKAKSEGMKAISALQKKAKGLIVEIAHKANKEGKLFAAVKKEEIIKQLTLQGVDLPEGIEISFSSPLKEVGEYKVEICFQDKKIPLKIRVKAL